MRQTDRPPGRWEGETETDHQAGGRLRHRLTTKEAGDRQTD